MIDDQDPFHLERVSKQSKLFITINKMVYLVLFICTLNPGHNDSNPRSYSGERRAQLMQPSVWLDAFGEKSPTATGTTSTTTHRSRYHTSQSPPSLDGEDFEPEAVAFALSEVVRRVAQAEKERDDALAAKRASEDQLLDNASQLKDKSDEIQQLKQVLSSMEEGKMV